MPVDLRPAQVYRIGAGLCGVVLLVFGCLGLTDGLAFFSTTGERVAGLSSNGLLSLISIVTAAVLIIGAVIGGNAASMISGQQPLWTASSVALRFCVLTPWTTEHPSR